MGDIAIKDERRITERTGIHNVRNGEILYRRYYGAFKISEVCDELLMNLAK